MANIILHPFEKVKRSKKLVLNFSKQAKAWRGLAIIPTFTGGKGYNPDKL